MDRLNGMQRKRLMIIAYSNTQGINIKEDHELRTHNIDLAVLTENLKKDRRTKYADK